MDRAVIQIVVYALFLIFALVVGQWVVTDQELAIVAVTLTLLLGVILKLGRNIWYIIPFLAAYPGSMSIIPGDFSPRDLSIILVVVLMVVYSIKGSYKFQFKIRGLDLLILIQILFIGFAYLRNPVGLRILGSDMVGGRDYFSIVTALIAFVILNSLRVKPKNSMLAVIFLILGALTSATWELMVGLFPVFGYYSSIIYRTGASTGASLEYVNSNVAVMADDMAFSVGRLGYLGSLVTPLVTFVTAKKIPTDLLNPKNLFYVLCVIVAVGAALFSGFRSLLVWGMLAVVCSIILRKRIDQLIFCMIGGFFTIVVLVSVQGTLIELPLSAQRALSFLPGDWDRMAVDDAEGSVDWRVEMWKEALTSDTIIRNKFIGDGYGFTQYDLNYQGALLESGMDPEELQEFYLRSGDFHSGPVETIKRVGYLGLFFLILLFIGSTLYTFQVVRFLMKTRMKFHSLYVGISLWVAPIFFLFVVGSYVGIIYSICLYTGLLRLMVNSVNDDKQLEKDLKLVEDERLMSNKEEADFA